MYAVKAEKLSKYYRVYCRPFDRFKEAITRRSCHQVVEALEGVSFQVPFGETLGVIGKMGPGNPLCSRY